MMDERICCRFINDGHAVGLLMTGILWVEKGCGTPSLIMDGRPNGLIKRKVDDVMDTLMGGWTCYG